MIDNLDLIATVVAHLIEATPATVKRVSDDMIAKVVKHFGADSGFLRYHNHVLQTSTLISHWPPQPQAGESTPLEAVHLTIDDPATGSTAPTVVRSGSADSPVSIATAPTLSGGTTGWLLGFVRSDGSDWTPEQLSVIKTLAPLFAQCQRRIAADDKLRKLTDHDELTGLHNRHAVVRHLSARLALGQLGPVAVVFLDGDRSKSINECFGHAIGDWYIQVLAQRLDRDLANVAMIARLAGDEFVVVPNEPMPTTEAEALAQRIRAVLREPLRIGAEVITPTVSIGLAVGSPGSDGSVALLQRADNAAMTAKRSGGDRVVIATTDMAWRSELRNDIELRLQGGIDGGALRLRYLPEVDLQTGTVTATEALVRWQHPTRGLLLPDSFIGVAESSNLAVELGRWVLRHACADLSRWRSRGVGLSTVLRVNVSPAQLTTPGFVDSIADALAEFGLSSSSLCLEITERAMVYDLAATRTTLAELKEAGVKIALDDFGTGYAVLSHLKSLPVDVLKIDATFVKDLGANPDDLSIVRAIIGLADAFGLDVVAEGVETATAAMTLLKRGCRRAQGFLLSRPVDAEAMESMLSGRRVRLPYQTDSTALRPEAPLLEKFGRL